ncbi:MAG: putative transcriptional regulator [Candidatus Moranbacteria bacterium GW2011_GWF2_36_839]|nr:MAG: putative transcriptional regulator [Candidatus Moranbacteria bacterium GW2011_GWF1_36_78]KKQ17296.1 MAG: putative transcriptional regulator [Candidatus Moranbacteria bacterium GW2011_GWF2_36_839]HAT73860.1 hypothetical protein [Candidatus Moranbacteria bacterium]HBY10997.1 hypothetical protein [Candidatus Moranbacteria bacterium]
MKNTKRVDWVGLLKMIRGKYSLNQMELAEKIGISKQTVSHYETGKYKPKTGTADLIKKAFPELPWDEISSGKEIYYSKDEHLVEMISRLFKLNVDELNLIKENIDFLLKQRTRPEKK